jgi:hypothetical protein
VFSFSFLIGLAVILLMARDAPGSE